MSEHTEMVQIFIKTFDRKSIEGFLKEVGTGMPFFAAVQKIFDEEDMETDIGNSFTWQMFKAKWGVKRNAFQVRRARYKIKFPLWVCIPKGGSGIH